MSTGSLGDDETQATSEEDEEERSEAGAAITHPFEAVVVDQGAAIAVLALAKAHGVGDGTRFVHEYWQMTATFDAPLRRFEPPCTPAPATLSPRPRSPDSLSSSSPSSTDSLLSVGLAEDAESVAEAGDDTGRAPPSNTVADTARRQSRGGFVAGSQSPTPTLVPANTPPGPPTHPLASSVELVPLSTTPFMLPYQSDVRVKSLALASSSWASATIQRTHPLTGGGGGGGGSGPKPVPLAAASPSWWRRRPGSPLLTSRTPSAQARAAGAAAAATHAGQGRDKVHARVVFLGACACGKTTLAQRVTNPARPMPRAYTMSMGAECFHHTQATPEGVSVNMVIWDFTGSPQYRALTRSYYLHTHVICLVYDCTDASNTLNELLTSWLPKEVRVFMRSAVPFSCMLVGCKLDAAMARGRVAWSAPPEAARVQEAAEALSGVPCPHVLVSVPDLESVAAFADALREACCQAVRRGRLALHPAGTSVGMGALVTPVALEAVGRSRSAGPKLCGSRAAAVCSGSGGGARQLGPPSGSILGVGIVAAYSPRLAPLDRASSLSESLTLSLSHAHDSDHEHEHEHQHQHRRRCQRSCVHACRCAMSGLRAALRRAWAACVNVLRC